MILLDERTALTAYGWAVIIQRRGTANIARCEAVPVSLLVRFTLNP